MTIRRIPNQVLPRNFKDWTGPLTTKAFGLIHQPDHSAFLKWAAARADFPEPYVQLIERMRAELWTYHGSWNEIELMMHFVGPLLKLVAFEGRDYGLFFHRPLRATVDSLRIGGIVDGVVAWGDTDPIQPYFFLKEYKKSQGYDNEPFGQLLISMVAAQQLNNDGQPLYGCYVIGKYWTFVLLAGDQYAVTQGYDATDAGELQIIWSMLVEVKRIVEERVERLLAQAQ